MLYICRVGTGQVKGRENHNAANGHEHHALVVPEQAESSVMTDSWAPCNALIGSEYYLLRKIGQQLGR